MDSNLAFNLLLRILPTAVLFVMAFIAASDKNSRERWAQLLYQIGNIRPEQREDIHVQRGVRWPFILVAIIFLIWPIRYYQYTTRTIELKPGTMQQFSASPSPTPTNAAAPESASTGSNTLGAVASPTPSATPLLNMFGTPMP